MAASSSTILDSPPTPTELLQFDSPPAYKRRRTSEQSMADARYPMGQCKILWVNCVPFVHAEKTNLVYCGTCVMSRDGHGCDSFVDCKSCQCCGMMPPEPGCDCECHILKEYYNHFRRLNDAKMAAERCSLPAPDVD